MLLYYILKYITPPEREHTVHVEEIIDAVERTVEEDSKHSLHH